MKKIFLILIGAVLLSGCAKVIPSTDNTTIINTSPSNQVSISPQKSTAASTSTPNPSSVELKVKFISQAPLANWDDIHNDACEEASVLNVFLYLKNENLSSSDADQKLVDMVDWQTRNWGAQYDLPVEKVKEFVKGYLNMDSTVSYDITMDSIKQELIKGNPIIVPAAGRSLGNPNFRSPGPVYHMLVIRGYDDKKQEFITNDVGTRKGDGYRYNYNVLFDAIHDMPKLQENKTTLDANPDMIFSGKKAMLIIK